MRVHLCIHSMHELRVLVTHFVLHPLHKYHFTTTAGSVLLPCCHFAIPPPCSILMFTPLYLPFSISFCSVPSTYIFFCTTTGSLPYARFLFIIFTSTSSPPPFALPYSLLYSTPYSFPYAASSPCPAPSARRASPIVITVSARRSPHPIGPPIANQSESSRAGRGSRAFAHWIRSERYDSTIWLGAGCSVW